MGTRRRSRELAMQALFFMDINKDYSEEMLDYFFANFNPPDNVRLFFSRLVKGVIGHMNEIDHIIKRFSRNWAIGRMSYVDRNIIRIGVYEMLYCRDIPFKVSINESVDIGKKFGTEESGSFINGVMDSIHLAIENQEIKTQQQTA